MEDRVFAVGGKGQVKIGIKYLTFDILSWSFVARTYAQVTENRTAEDAEKPVRWAGSPTCSRSVSPQELQLARYGENLSFREFLRKSCFQLLTTELVFQAFPKLRSLRPPQTLQLSSSFELY